MQREGYARVEGGEVAETAPALPEIFGAMTGFNLLDDAGAAEHGWFPFWVVRPDFDPFTQRLDGPSYEVAQGQVVATYTVAELAGDELAEGLRRAKLVKQSLIDQEHDARSAAFPWNFGTEAEPNWQTLQVRDNKDRTNWLGLKDSCDEAVAEGLGDLPVDPPLKCTSNAEFAVTISETVTILRAMRTWTGAMLKHSWDLKKAVDAAADAAAVAAIDHTAGWP